MNSMIIASLLLVFAPSIINPFSNFQPRVPCHAHEHDSELYLKRVNRRVAVMDTIWKSAEVRLDQAILEGVSSQEAVSQFWFTVMPPYRRAKTWYVALTREFCNEH
jgi:hypothetical protein